jgi:D-amino-acid dehydrogenase
MYFAHDEVGNCRQFAQLLKERFVECGGELHIGTHVIAIAGAARPEIQTQNKGTLAFDRVVICTGATGANLAIPELKGLALAHVSSTSVSAQIREPLNAPRNAVMDWHNRISISRLGTRIRISGGASLGRRPSQVSQRDQRRLFQTLQSHFPGAADFSRSIQIWQGTSAFSPDALPLIGASERPGVWLNLAHGHNGWGMAFGAARLIADQIGDKPAAIDTTRLKPGRFKS